MNADEYADSLARIMNVADAKLREMAETAMRTNQALKDQLADAEVFNGDLAEVLASTRTELDVWLAEVDNLQAHLADAKVELTGYRTALTAIAHHEHCNYYFEGSKAGEYGTGVTDGHRCAATIAQRALGEDVPE